MEDLLSITKDIGEYYIYHKDNSNLIAKGYERFWLRKWPLEPQKSHLNGLYLLIRSIYKTVKVDLKIHFKISVMKRRFENQKHKA